MSEKKRSIILVPHDFSHVAESAVNYAIELAKLFNNEIYLLHIVESGLLESKSSVEKDEQESIDKLNAIAAGITQKAPAIKATAIVKRGSIFEMIGETADELDTNLVVMGTHGVKGLQFITGSRAIRVITSSSAPFVVVQQKPLQAQGFKNIVLPLDLTAETKAKLPWAVYLGKNFGATFHLFVKEEKDEFLAKHVSNNLAFAESFFKKNGVEYTVTHDDEGGDFARQVIRFASSKHADLIVIMTQVGRDDLASYVLGPDDQRIVANDAQVPVMCVNPKEDTTIFKSVLTI
jgi:nucleotide-binding universal stress UspA family protein